jgi:hypothetical protein
VPALIERFECRVMTEDIDGCEVEKEKGNSLAQYQNFQKEIVANPIVREENTVCMCVKHLIICHFFKRRQANNRQLSWWQFVC